MNYKIVAFTIALAVVLMSSVLFFVVSIAAKQAQTEVFRQQEDLQLNNPLVTQGLFGVSTPDFATITSCDAPPFMQEAYVNLVLRYREVPRSCTYWVNDRYVRTERDLAPSCIHECPVGEFSRTVALGEYDVRDNHVVKVCCNDICVERSLQSSCEFSGTGRTSVR